MDLEKRLADLEAKFSEKSEAFSELEREKIALAEENAKLKEETEKAFKAYKDAEAGKLNEALAKVPAEMKEKLFKAIDETAGNNIVFSTEKEEKVSLYSVLCEVIKQVSFSENVETDSPNIADPSEDNADEQVYKSGYESTKALTC